MLDQSPERARTLRHDHLGGQRRDWASLVRVVQGWSRQRQVSDKSKMKEVDKRKFYSKMIALNYTDPEIERKWERATSAAKIKAGLCRKVGKQVLVFMPKSREVESADIMSLTLEGDKSESLVNAAHSKQMLEGQHAIDLGLGAKKRAFGGVL